MNRVSHKTYGEGTILSREENLVTVKFDVSGAEKSFLYPDAFAGDFSSWTKQ